MKSLPFFFGLSIGTMLFFCGSNVSLMAQTSSQGGTNSSSSNTSQNANVRTSSSTLTPSSSSNSSSTSASAPTQIRSMDAINMDSGGFIGGGSGDFIGGGSATGTNSSAGTSNRASTRTSANRSSTNRNSTGNMGRGNNSSSRNSSEIRSTFVIAFDPPKPSETGRLIVNNPVAVGTKLNKLTGLKKLGPVTVEMNGREAVLKGTLKTEHDRKIAELVIRLEPGVSTVRNEITVVNSSP